MGFLILKALHQSQLDTLLQWFLAHATTCIMGYRHFTSHFRPCSHLCSSSSSNCSSCTSKTHTGTSCLCLCIIARQMPVCAKSVAHHCNALSAPWWEVHCNFARAIAVSTRIMLILVGTTNGSGFNACCAPNIIFVGILDVIAISCD